MEFRKFVKAEKQQAVANMMERLPQEVVIGIPSRLPITSLIQSKLVCRAWRRLIQDPLLASEHFSRMADNDPCFVLQSQWPASYLLYFNDFSHESEGNFIPKKLPHPFKLMSLIDSCNGLLCMRDSQAIYVYNPFTRVSIELPKHVDFPELLGHFDFGFHPTTEEYKLVRIRYRLSSTNVNEYYSLVQNCEVSVLTIGSPAWRNLGIIPHRFVLQGSTILINGKLHWLSRPKGSFINSSLISFDLGTEKFQEVATPDCCRIDKCYSYLMALRGCVSMVAYQNKQLEIWVMKAYGVKESWVKEYNIGICMPQILQQLNIRRVIIRSRDDFPSSFVRVICTLKSGEIVLEYQSRSLVLYDPQQETFKVLTFPDMPARFKTIAHVGSLNWLDTPVKSK